MIIVEEMQKLRKWLDDNNIQWQDKSEDYSKSDFTWWICRTHFDINGSHVSVINGHGTYGGIDIIDKTNHGLLEIMCGWMDDVTGYLTADEVISIIKEHEENNGR